MGGPRWDLEVCACIFSDFEFLQKMLIPLDIKFFLDVAHRALSVHLFGMRSNICA